MRLRVLLAGLLILLPLPALADVTAHYAAGSGSLTIEADDSGDWRFDLKGGTPLVVLRRDGVHYMVFTGPDGQVGVVLAEELIAAIAGKIPDPKLETAALRLVAGPTGSVLGYSGMTWRLIPDDNKPLEVLLSPDPTLAPVGNAFRYLSGLLGGVLAPMIGGGVDFNGQVRLLFAKGTPLRMGAPGSAPKTFALELESVSTADVASSRFALPGPLIPADAVISAWTAARD